MKVWDSRPWTPELRAQSQVRGLLTFKRSQVKSLDALQEVIRSDQTISDRVRQLALDWSPFFWADPDPISMLQELGAKIEQNWKGEVLVVGADEFSNKITDAALVHFKGMTGLQTLRLSNTQVTDAGLVHLGGMNLKRLTIPKEAKTDIGLKHYLAAVEPPSFLLLEGWQLTNAGLVHLKGLTSLRTLSFRRSDTRVTDAGLVHLKGMTSLQKLDIYGTQITDAGLVHLAGLTKLQTLRLGSSRITDAGLEHLKGLPGLQELDFGGSQITDAGLAHIKELTRLQDLLLPEGISDAGIAELQNALPKCKISKKDATSRGSRGAGRHVVALMDLGAKIAFFSKGEVFHG